MMGPRLAWRQSARFFQAGAKEWPEEAREHLDKRLLQTDDNSPPARLTGLLVVGPPAGFQPFS